MEKSFSLKDELFNLETVTEFANAIKRVYKSFDTESYVERCMEGFKKRELKERMSYMCECLETDLPDDFYEVTEIMLEVCSLTDVKAGFVYGAFCEYVEKHGCSDEYLIHSLKTLGELTKVFSAEFAIRTFLNSYPEESFEWMNEWAKSDDPDQRRLASEGLRAKLPWGKKIEFDPVRAIEPLEYLYYDTEQYVTRSVANHLNDLSKINPDIVIETLARWKNSKKQNEGEMEYIIGHSTRTLVKKCHIGALELQGYKTESNFEIKDFKILTPEIHIGERLVFEFEIIALENMNLMIDFKIDYPMPNGKKSIKVFKIKKTSLTKGENLEITKKYSFRAMTTKKLYSGKYKVSLQINGKTYSGGFFHLEV